MSSRPQTPTSTLRPSSVSTSIETMPRFMKYTVRINSRSRWRQVASSSGMNFKWGWIASNSLSGI